MQLQSFINSYWVQTLHCFTANETHVIFSKCSTEFKSRFFRYSSLLLVKDVNTWSVFRPPVSPMSWEKVNAYQILHFQARLRPCLPNHFTMWIDSKGQQSK